VLGWIAVLPKGSWVDESIEQLVVRQSLQPVGQSEPVDQTVRTLAWQSLSQIQLRFDSSRQWILEHLGNASPLELPAAIDAYCKGSTSPQDQRLLETLATVAASKTLAVETLLVKLKDRPAEVQKKWRESLEVWTKPDQDVQDKVQLWLGKLLVGDPKQGYHVFRSSKATCSACHQVGYVGGNVGPILSKIGQSRSRRDLLEAILFPSARLEQAYRSTKVRLQDGEVLQGLVVSETPKELVLQVSVDQRRSIETSEIQLREPSNVSIMPAGLESQLSLQELSDLIAFLENAK
jgi:putative heme-binding domain-containing protein